MNDDTRPYMASEKALHDMACVDGYKPSRRFIDNQLREAARRGELIFVSCRSTSAEEREPAATAIRPPDRLGRHRMDILYPSGPSGQGRGQLAKEWKKAPLRPEADIAKEDLSEFEQKLVEIERRRRSAG
jgi:hypothetical protein